MALLLNKNDMSNLRVTSGASGPAFKLGSGFPAFRVNGGAPDMRGEYLTIEAVSDTTVRFYAYKNDLTASVEVSVDGGQTWESRSSNTAGTVLAQLAAGDKLFIRGTDVYGDLNYIKAVIYLDGGNAYLYGNAMSLVYGAEFADKNTISNSLQLSKLFSEYYAVRAPMSSTQGHWLSHPANALLFPATLLTTNVYIGTFYGCSELTRAPELPAPVVPSNAYNEMFRDCTKLKEVTCLATSFAQAPRDWLRNVSPTGTFTKAVGAEWGTGASGIPDGWTVREV